MINHFSVHDQKFRVKRLDPILAFNIWNEFTTEWDKAGLSPIDFSEENAEMPSYYVDEFVERFKDEDESNVKRVAQRSWESIMDTLKTKKSVLTRINRLPARYMEELRIGMFQTVEAEVNTGDSGSWVPLSAEYESMIFDPLDNFAVSEVTIRAFFTHFKASFKGAETLFLELMQEMR